MPLSLHITEGVLPSGTEKKAVKQITDVFLKWHGLAGNRVMTPNVTAMVQVLPASSTFSGGEAVVGAWIEWKTPSFAFADREIQQGIAKASTDIIYELSGAKLPRDNIYFNVVHTVDGTWNLDGVAMTNEQLGEAISAG
ncbi:MAG TPA: 4-oxalocrotonate tautomerase [Gammaproteobacteria bacterium]|nr:4-oxalocrotonate tautomerase [Gammaproteobacteria bacterium]